MITFSSDIGQKLEDRARCRLIAEEYFKTTEDTSQIQITEENSIWMYNHFPESLNIIKEDDKVIGFTFILLSDDYTMDLFLNNTSENFSEQNIIDDFKKNFGKKEMPNVYLCASVVLEAYRGRGLALEGFKKQIKKIFTTNHVAALYSWPFSDAGKKLSEKISSELGMKLFLRNST